MARAHWKIVLNAFLIIILLITVAGCIKMGNPAASCQFVPACSLQKATDNKTPSAGPQGNQSGAGSQPGAQPATQPAGQDSNVISQSGGVAVANWIGTWQCGQYKMYLDQSGDVVTGWHEYQNADIEGKAAGNALTGTRTSSNVKYYFQLSQSSDGKSFTGGYRAGSSGDWDNKWSCTRTSSARPPAKPTTQGLPPAPPSGSQPGIGVLQPSTVQPSGSQPGIGVLQPTQSAGWTGTWQCGSTTAYLTQSGDTVTGWYSYQNGRMYGTVEKNVVSGIWSQYPVESANWPNVTSVQFIMSLDGSSYEWKQRLISSANWDTVGKCTRTNSAQPPSPTPPANWGGQWLCGQFGRLKLSQTGEDVTGTYSYQGGKVTAKAIGNMLVGTWSEEPTYSAPDDSGYFKFKMSADTNSFTGEWCKGTTGVDGTWNGQRDR